MEEQPTASDESEHGSVPADCQKPDYLGGRDGFNELEDFDTRFKRVSYFSGVIHLILLVFVVAYLVASKIRNHRMSKFQWTYLILLGLMHLLSCIVLFGFFGLGDNDNHSCFFYRRVFFGATDICLFNISILIGFKLYAVINNLYQFAVKGNLPSRWYKRRNWLVLKSVWFASIADLAIFLFLNIYWTFVDREISKLNLFNFVNRLAQITLILLNSVLFFAAYVLTVKTLNYTLVDQKQRRLHRVKNMMLTLGIVYAVLAGLLFWALYLDGNRTKWEIVNFFFQNIFYIVSQTLLFLIMITVNLDFRLQTQVLHNGQVLIVAVDKFNRDVFQIKMKRAPKKKPKVKDPDEQGDHSQSEVSIIEDAAEGFLNDGQAEINQWRPVNDQSDQDNLTANTMSEFAQSPMSSFIDSHDMFVEDYKHGVVTPVNARLGFKNKAELELARKGRPRSVRNKDKKKLGLNNSTDSYSSSSNSSSSSSSSSEEVISLN